MTGRPALRVGIVQRTIPPYRAPLFDALARQPGLEVEVLAGATHLGDDFVFTAPTEASLHQVPTDYLPGPHRPLFWWQRGLRSLLQGLSVDVVFVEANPRALSTYFLSVRRARPPMVGWGLGRVSRSRRPLVDKLSRSWSKALFRRLDGYVAYSSEAVRTAIDLGVPADRVWVAPNSVDSDQAREAVGRRAEQQDFESSWRLAHGLRPQTPTLLFVGKLMAQKRVDLLLEAVATMGSDVQVLIVGDGPQRRELEELRDRLGVSGVFMGDQRGQDASDAFLASDLVVLPGLGGLAIHHAMSHGKPVVVGTGDGTESDLIIPGETGFRFRSEDGEDLARTLRTALSDMDQLRRMGLDAMRFVDERFGFEKMAQAFRSAAVASTRRRGPRVSYISMSHIPSRTANSVHVMKMCQGLVEAGCEVELVIPRARGDFDESSLEDVFDAYGIRSRFSVRRLWSPGRGRPRSFGLLAAVRNVLHSKDLVITRHLTAGMVSAWLKRPTMIELHSPVPRRWRKALTLTARLSSLRAIVCITDALRSRILEDLGSGGKLAVLPDGVDLGAFEEGLSPADARRLLGMDDRPTCVYAGHLYAGRGVEVIIEAARSMPGVQLVVVGGRDEDVERLRMAGLPPNVRLIGHVDPADVPMWLAAGDVLLMPYQRAVAVSGGGDTAQWMSPLKMFEYLAASRAIVASDLPVLREVLDERTAVLVQPDCPRRWAAQISLLLSDDERRGRLADEAGSVAKRYSWQSRAAAILSLGVLSPR